ncbi:MAG TPA: methyltransferase domain-containing protein [Vicinamibacterales bacterium]|nr:methyltransferase domain-containing protein [Vicinamibacterales bacterium]
MGNAREEVLTTVRDGHYAAKQIYSRDRLVAFSHQRRFRTAVDLASRFRGQRMLDYGCGDGTLIALLHEAGAAPALAVGADLDDRQVDDCRARLGQLPGVRFERIADLDTPPHRGAYDGVICTEVLEHVVDLDAVIDSLHRLVRDEGTLIVSVPVETGLPLVVKQAVRRIAGWRGVGDYKWTSAYTWRELAASVCAGRRPHIARPIYHGTTGVPFHDHKGFNWKALADRLSTRFAIERILASPFARLGPSLATQVWFVARKLPV